MGGRVLGRSVINVPSAVVTRLMTLLSDDMLGAHPRGAWLEQLQAPLAPRHQFCTSPLQNLKTKTMFFTLQQPYGGSHVTFKWAN